MYLGCICLELAISRENSKPLGIYSFSVIINMQQCSYFVYPNELVPNVFDPNMRFILSYKLSTSRNYVETKLKSLIEVPFHDEDEDPGIDFQVNVLFAKTERNVRAKLRFEDCGLTLQQSRKQFALPMQDDTGDDIKFVLIVETKALLYEEPPVLDEATIRNKLKEEIQVFGLDVLEKKGMAEMLEARRQIVAEQNLLTSSRWFIRYKIEIKLQRQCYTVFLDDDDPTTIYYFFVHEDDRNLILTVKLIELVFYDYGTDYLRYDQQEKSKPQKDKIKLSSQSPIGQNVQLNLLDFYIGKNSQKTAFSIDQVLYENFSVRLKFTFLKRNDFVESFLGYSAIKILETRIFSSDVKISHLEVRMKSLDPTALPQKWILKPFDTQVKETYVKSTWDFQHTLLVNKLSQQNQTGYNSQDSRKYTPYFDKLYQKTLTPVDPKILPLNSEFTDIVKYYERIGDYEPIIQKFNFSQRQNHIFFRTYSPMDYIEFIVEGEPIADKKSVLHRNMIGCMSTSMFKVAQNQLVIGFLIKGKNGIEMKNCLSQFEDQDDEDEVQQDLEELLDNQQDELIGTIKYYVNYQGYNSQMFKSKSWINKLSNSNFDPYNFLNLMRAQIQNKISLNPRQFVVRIKLTEIWNLIDLYNVIGYAEELEVAVKLGQVSYSIPLVVSFENKDQFRKEKHELAFKLDRDQKKCVFEDDHDKRHFYFNRNEEEYTVVTIDQDISGDMVFQVYSSMDQLIVSLRQVTTDSVYCFTSESLSQVPFTANDGYFVVPMKLNVQSKLTSVFFIKFKYLILNDFEEPPTDTGIYHFGVYVLPQQFNEVTKEKARKELYEVLVESVTGEMRRHSRQIDFNQQMIHFNTYKIPGAEFWRMGQFLAKIVVKKVYSDIDDQFSNSHDNTLKTVHLLINSDGTELTGVRLDQTLKIKPNDYSLYELQFRDEKLYDHHLKIIIYCGFRSSSFIKNPRGQMVIKIPKQIQAKMIDSGILSKNTILKFKVQSMHLYNNKEKQKENEQQIDVETQGIQIALQTYRYNDNLVFQDVINGKFGETDLTRLSDLVLIPWSTYQATILQHQDVTNKTQPEEEDDDIRSVKTIVSSKDDRTKHTAMDMEISYWTFISYNDKRLEFLAQFIPSLVDEELEQKRREEQLKKLKQQEERRKQQEDLKLKSITEIKAAITKFQDDNTKLGTQVQKERKQYEKNQQIMQTMRDIDEKSNRAPQKPQIQYASKPLPPVLQNHTYAQVVNKTKELFKTICQCGATNPKFKYIYRIIVSGFCKECLEKMRVDYEAAYKDYMPVAQEYENLYTKNMSVDLKMVQMKAKINNMKKRLTYDGDQGDMDPDEKMIKDEMNYLKTQCKYIQAECGILNNEFYRTLDDKLALRNELQTRIQRKLKKLDHLNAQKEEYQKKIQEITELLKIKEHKLAEFS